MLIRTAEELKAFRDDWTGEAILDLIQEHGGRLLVNWPAGVGKSYNLDQTAESAIRTGRYDLVIVLASRTAIIEERKWIKHRPQDIGVVSLKPRPKEQCGAERDRQWRTFEDRRLTTFGRREICGGCPLRKDCFWPEQYHGEKLNGVQVIYGTHALLSRIPGLIRLLKQGTGANRVLALIDEAHFMLKGFRRQIKRQELELFVTVLQELQRRTPSGRNGRWLYLSKLLLDTQTEDLRCPQWKMPFPAPGWVDQVQELGWLSHGEHFKFIGYDLEQFGHSELHSREKDEKGNVLFAARPFLPCDHVVYSSTADPDFTSFRLGHPLACPFADHRFQHAGTTWYNIASNIGTRKHFPANSRQILDFFAALTARRLQEGKRVALVAKDRLAGQVAEGIEERLHRLGLTHCRVQREFRLDEPSPFFVPVIHYGLEGINDFEGYDCIYCVTGYYVNEDVLDKVLQDVVAPEWYIAIRLQYAQTSPRRRHAGVADPQDRFYDVDKLAEAARRQKESAVVVQAVGRVRPFTKPREVITFQCDQLPNVSYSREFLSLKEAREHFGILTGRSAATEVLKRRIRELRQAGMKQREAAEKLEVSLSTVKRYWRK